MLKIKTIKETVVGQIEVTDLDLDVIGDLLGDFPDVGYNWVETPHEYNWVENDLISIEILQKTINRLKDIDANYVRIMSHCDHHSYYFSGCNLEVMTEVEIKENEELKLKKELEDYQKILKIETDNIISRKLQIKLIKNKLENL